ncbi:MAG: hypothetical protein LBQ94_02610 [Treponema sp.]|jgi:hypothetical protein|nr:hypothetical protein [Treponema sp.]
MTITQTIEIPADHRLTIEVPREVPAGPALVTFAPVGLSQQTPIADSLLGVAANLGNVSLEEIRYQRIIDKALPKGQKIKLTKQMAEKLLNSEPLRSLTGILHTETSAEEIRAERLEKYDHID